MIIGKRDKEVLVRQKIKEGHDSEIANYEIERDNCFITNARSDYRDLQRENKALHKEIVLLKEKMARNALKQLYKEHKEQVKPLKKSKLAKDLPEDNFKKKVTSYCSIQHLRRVLRYFETTKEASITQIKEDCCLQCRQCVDYLVELGILKIKLIIDKEVFYKNGEDIADSS